MASPRPDPLARVDRVLAPLTALAAAFAVVVLLLGPQLIGAKKAGAQTGARSGKQIFTAEGCGGCHTLAAAGSSGTAGPDLDQLKPDAATVKAKVPSGGASMPSFKLPAPELDALAQYVSSVAGR
jgi:mono/diheme cytochrome c family protein